MLKKFISLGLCTVMLLMSCVFTGSVDVKAASSYTFDGNMSRVVLENYLNRSVTLMDMCQNWTNDTKRNDMTRFMKNVGAKFWGRAAGVWSGFNNDGTEWTKASNLATYVHGQDTEIILQAAIYETTDTTVNDISIPAWVFQAFNQTVLTRNFNYNSMLFSDGTGIDAWGVGSSIPDITKLETQMWIYYRAIKYIDCGFEALHLGQAERTGGYDTNFATWKSVISKIRSYASTHARRKNVLIDAHSNSMKNGSDLLLDFISYPSRIKETSTYMDAVLDNTFLDSIIGKSIGGNNPQGWYCARSPYLLELDNTSGIDGVPGQTNPGISTWGYDEIAWFAHTSTSYRASWRSYAINYLNSNDPNGHFQIPTERTLGNSLGSTFYSGFESTDTQLTWQNTINYSSNVSGTGLWADTSAKSSGTTSIKFSGNDNSTTSSYCYWKAFDVNIPVNLKTHLFYNLLALNDNGRYAGVDIVCTDGTTLRETNATSQFNVRMHPAFAKGIVNKWVGVQSNIGKWLNGKTIDYIMIGYDRASSTGAFSGYIDEITISDFAAYDAVDWGEEASIKSLWQ